MKIFNISFHRNATTSFHNFMGMSGYKCIHDVNISNSMLKCYGKFTGEISDDVLLNATSKHDVFSDNPWPVLYKQLHKLYPDAKFILFHRDSQKWCDSIEKYFGNSMNYFRKYLYNNTTVKDNRDIYIDIYNKHNQDVINYFEECGNMDNLLIIDLEKYDNVGKVIYEFIEHEGKRVRFPFNRGHIIRRK